MIIDTMEQLEAVYDAPIPSAAKASDLDKLIPPYVQLIEASPFFVLATSGAEGLDCSARGDPPGFVRVQDERTIIFPDRRGNNKIDSLRNIICNPLVSLMFLIPGTGIILRINGRAQISIDEGLLASFAIGSALPRSAVIVTVEMAFMQCARAIIRSKLWDAAGQVDQKCIPSMGDVLAYVTNGREGGKQFDEVAPTRMMQSLW
ncbi:pyridoxamine 5'-phosphate oxidase [Sphingobium sp. Leaf26]|uniref:MSMEG_1061 family FMN-dependent PPOX-type flavoprotein n=1 Tax=Sphingobium sp. Leaf26 TaxID=1735693 RepID=UPI0006FED612|nr:MSMEG_1061 family FMN-dependent PPOX-type flavoprotein [Sphingobium sp. Leaf26]KQN07147.1 pyridoxamine 5'-phosphate oxidase [Sphingobium sp. Leaf26]